MRTDPDLQQALYNDLPLVRAAAILGISTEHALALGRAGDLEVSDYRMEGAKRGVYRVTHASVEALRKSRRINRVA